MSSDGSAGRSSANISTARATTPEPLHPINTQSTNASLLDHSLNNSHCEPEPYVPVYKHVANYGGTFKATCVNFNADPETQEIPEIVDEPVAENPNDTLNSTLNESSTLDLSDITMDGSEIQLDDDENEAFEYTDDDLDEALLAEGDIVEPEIIEAPKNSIEPEDDDPITPINTPKNLDFEIQEGHYMPMTPKKLNSSASASETSIFAMDILNSIKNSAEMNEENPYIEMTHGLSDGSNKGSSNYEMVMVSNAEPLYMELAQKVSDGKSTIKKSTLKRQNDKGSNRKAKRSPHDLPDILKQSQQTYLKSDSSDADDESPTKDLDGSRTRFSLSDTFRPASYYLGASTSSSSMKNSPLNESVDSSDSEIVSPPPIPTSPPPMEEMATEELFSSENFDTIKRIKDHKVASSSENIHKRTLSTSSNPAIHMSETSIAKALENTRNSRLSLPDQLYKQKAGSNNYLNLTKLDHMKNMKFSSTASNCSINTDDGSNTSSDFDLYNKIKMQSPSISADSLNQSQLSLEEKPTRARPRPLSEDSLSRFEESTANDKLDQYLNKLEGSSLYSNHEQANWIQEHLKKMPQPIQLYENMKFSDPPTPGKQSSNTSNTSVNLLYYDSLEDVSKTLTQETSLQPLKEQNLSLHDANYETEDLKHTKFQIDVASIDLDQQSACTVFDLTQPSHSRQNSNLSDSAPYYYSDLMNATVMAANQKLNNQRDLNSIKKNPNYIHNLITAATKDQIPIDSRNIYDSESGRMNKFVEKSETTTSFANKMYFNEKRTNVDNSIDNLLYNVTDESQATGCDELWEEDAIWRESLRRVSQRHARSLDDLDRIGNLSRSSVKAARISDADRQWGVAQTSATSTPPPVEKVKSPKNNPKITRDVTYVNEGQYQRTLTKKKNVDEKDGKSEDDNDVYVQLACSTNEAPEPSDVYEILREDDAQVPARINYASYDIDRENIRQWDLMSSGLVKSSSTVLKNGVPVGLPAKNSANTTAHGTEQLEATRTKNNVNFR